SNSSRRTCGSAASTRDGSITSTACYFFHERRAALYPGVCERVSLAFVAAELWFVLYVRRMIALVEATNFLTKSTSSSIIERSIVGRKVFAEPGQNIGIRRLFSL